MSGRLQEIKAVTRRTLVLIMMLICIPLAAFGIISSGIAPLTARVTKNTAAERQSGSLKNEYEQDLKSIETLREARNLEGLALLADEIEMKWPQRHKHYYASLMIEVVGAFSGYDFKDDRQYVLALKYAKAALKMGDRLPLEAEIKLVRFLQGGPEYTTGQMKAEEWAQDRSERVKRWLHAWQRLEKEINRNFDFNNRPQLNVRPPAGYGPAGIAPESIKDSKARAEYESAIAANKKRIAEYNKQWQLRQLDNYFTPYASQFMIEAYSKEPHNLAELKKYLDDYLTNEDLKEKIINEVKKKMTE